MNQNRTPMLVLVIAGLLMTLAPTGSTAEAAPVQQLDIIDRAIEHHGGARYTASSTSLDMCSKSGCFAVQARVDGGRFEFTVRGKAGEVERTVRWTNDRLERWNDGVLAPIAATDEQALRDWVMARVYFPFLPFRLNDPSVWKQDLGREAWDGRALHRVKVTFTAGTSSDADDEYTYWFDPETGRVEHLAYTYKGSPGGLRFRTATNHREVGGILFFDQENYGAEGDTLSVDDINPAYAATLEHVSTVELRNIVVRDIE